MDRKGVIGSALVSAESKRVRTAREAVNGASCSELEGNQTHLNPWVIIFIGNMLSREKMRETP